MELKFKNSSIEKYKSKQTDFFDKKGRSKPVITSFKMGAKYKGLCLREYHSGAKHFIVRFRLKGDRKRERIFPVGKLIQLSVLQLEKCYLVQMNVKRDCSPL